MDEYVGDQVLQWYERIERHVVAFAEQVPLTAENENLAVPTLISWLMDACGLLDSVFRDLTPDPTSIKGKTKDDWNIQDFAKLYADSLDLTNTRSILLVSPPRYLSPFEPWKEQTEQGHFHWLALVEYLQ